MDVAAMCEFIHADSLAFASNDGLYRAVGLPGRNGACPQYCGACFTDHCPMTDLVDSHRADAQLSLPVNNVACGRRRSAYRTRGACHRRDREFRAAMAQALGASVAHFVLTARKARYLKAV